MRESVWAVLCFTPPSFVNSGSPERRVAQRGHSNSRDSLSTSRENLWKPILLDRPYRGFLCCFLLFCFEGVYRQLRIESRSEDKKKTTWDFIFCAFLFCSIKIRIQGWASEAFYALCCLLSDSQLITFSAEIVSPCLKTVNTTIQSVCCQLASLFLGCIRFALHISSCANVLCTS